MKLRILLLLGVLSASASMAAAQKNDLGLLIGGNIVGNQSINSPGFQGTSVSVNTAVTYEAAYARRFFNAGIAGLYIEVPVVGTPSADVSSADPNATSKLASLFVTPGIKLKLFPGSGFSPWASVGGGLARFDEGRQLQNGIDNPGPRNTNTSAVQFGGGLDLRVLPFIGVRGEIRDFYTGSPQYNVSTSSDRQHNLLVAGGFVLNF